MTAVRTIDVPVTGTREASGPLTLAQRNAYQWTAKLTDDHFLSMVEWTLTLPPGVTVPAVCVALATVVGRHESLRTTYHDGLDGPVQRVHRTGVLPVQVHDVPPGPVDDELPWAMIRRLRATPFELTAGLPLRVALAATGTTVRAAVVVYSHLAVDYVAMAVVDRELAELLGKPGTPHRGTPHQPLDQVAAESAPRGRRRAEAALRYWEEALRRRPASVLPAVTPAAMTGGDPAGGDPAGGDPDAALGGRLRSARAAAAIDAITARTGTSRSMVVLAALSAVLARYTGQQHVVINSPAGNRLEARLRDYVGTIAQDGILTIGVDGVGFDGLIRRAGTAMLRANRHSVFDADALQRVHDRVAHERGVELARDCVFNNVSEATGPEQIPADWLRGTAIDWLTPARFPTLLLFQLVYTRTTLILVLITGDRRQVPAGTIETLLLGIERVITAAADADLPLEQVPGIAGFPEPRGGDDWRYVDHSWVRLSEIGRLVGDAVAVPAGVFVAAGPTPVITAHLTASDTLRTPAQVHAECLRRLGNRYAAMTPHRYVLHQGAPADPGDRDGWLRLPVLAEGDGRCPSST